MLYACKCYNFVYLSVMDIENVTVLSMRPVPVDVTSCHDVNRKYIYPKTEFEFYVTVRNDDVAPLRIWTELEGVPKECEAIEKIKEILFELS